MPQYIANTSVCNADLESVRGEQWIPDVIGSELQSVMPAVENIQQPNLL